MLKKVLSIALAVVLVLGLFAVLLLQPSNATGVSEMTVSEELVKLLEKMEGFKAIPHWDYSQWTVGFGSTCPEEDLERYLAEGISPEEADVLLHEQLKKFEADVNAFMVQKDMQLTQNQFDALVSFVYNVGSSVLRNDDSTVIQAILNGAQGNDFMYAIGQWCAAGGDFVYGLLRRRMMEAYMYLYGTYSNTLPNTFCYVRYDPNGGERDTRAQGYDSNMAATPLSVPTREGYIFTGWYTEASGGEKVTELDASTNGLTLYAHWEVGTQMPDKPTDPETGITVTVSDNAVTVRKGPGSAYEMVTRLYQGEKITVTGLSEKEGTLWGYFARGWVCLEYTDYFEVTGTARPGGSTSESDNIQVPIKATVLSNTGVAVYRGPHTTYPETGFLSEGDTVQILETMTFCNLLWGRYEGGWIRLNQKILLHDDQVLAHSFIATVTYYYLNVRSGPGTDYSTVTQLKTGDQMEIFSIVLVDGIPWGRFISGWVYLNNYTDFDISKLPYYQDHSFSDWYTSVETSCSRPGQQRRDCRQCDHYELRETEMIDHSMGDWYTSKEGTCVAEGQERRDCRNCDYCETRSTALGDHGFGQWYVSVEATCVTIGQERRDCQYCDHYETKETALGDHSYQAWYVAVLPGCETVGQERRDCRHCDYFETREVAAVGHSYGDWHVTVEAGCETVGQQQRDCTNCDHFETREVAAVGHSYGDWHVTAETGCETVGQQQRDCTNCDHYETQEIPATGHSFGQWYETVKPTANAEGEARRDCKNCEHYETQVLPADPHVYGQWYVYTEATCVTPGEERRDCQHCDEFESRPMAVTDHSLGDWYTSAEATCIAAGQERRDCQHCQYFETRETALGDHVFGDWFVSADATCVTPGQQRRDCTVCDHYETRETALGGHSFDAWYVFQASGCETEGQERRECIHCDQYESRPMAATGHSFDAWYVFQASGCETEGQERRECIHCDRYESRPMAAAGHSFDQWHVSNQASCTEEGQERRDCVNCDYYEIRDTAMLDHSYGKWYILIAPTIDAEGLQCRDCVNCSETQTSSLPVLPSVERVYATITANSLNVRAEASSSTAKTGALYTGLVVEILEQKTVGSNVWGRIEYGWICLTGYTTLKTVREADVADTGDKTYATVTANYLSIRPEPDSSTARLGTIQTGGRVRIYETVTVGNVQWGRTAMGWIWLTGYVSMETEPGEHTEHIYGDWYVFQTGTCVTPAQERRDCTGCDYYETRVGQLGNHSFGQWFVTVEATCAAEGQEQRDCLLCDHYEIRNTAALQEHVFGNWYIAAAPGCETPGQQCRDCLYCEYFESKAVHALGHSFDDWYVTTAPGCETPGQQRRDCLNCEHNENEVVPALGHSFGDWYVTTAPGCETSGQQRRDCLNCEHNENEVVPALGHSFGDWYVTTAPGCETPGQQRRDCLNCEHNENEVVPALGHSFDDWYVTKEATTDEPGQERRDCEACSHFETRETDKLPAPTGKIYGTFTGNGYLNIREGAGTSYKSVAKLYAGKQVEILELVDVNGTVWGRVAEGWICVTGYVELEYEESTPSSVTKLYATVTYLYLTIRAGANSSTSKLGTLDQGDVVEIYEIVNVSGKDWGRMADGWICLTGYATLATVVEEEENAESIRIYATVTHEYLTIRAGTNSNTSKLGTLDQGAVVEILEIVAVGSKNWGRTAEGWICLTGYATLSAE